VGERKVSPLHPQHARMELIPEISTRKALPQPDSVNSAAQLNHSICPRLMLCALGSSWF